MAAVKVTSQKHQDEDWLASPATWAAATAAAGVVACAAVQPSSCAAVPQCAEKHEAISTNFNTYAAYGLMMVLVGETANLMATFAGAQEAQSMIRDLRSRCLPSLLLVLSFIVLIGESSIYAAGQPPWFSSNRPDLQEPVFTATFIEWLIIVPMLLVMAGYCALGRPMRELGRPIVVTNVYIIMSWAALLTTDLLLRWSLIAMTFAMYFWASWDMIIWVAKYLQTAPADLSSRALRPCLSLGLIALFAIYAVVYMSVLFGVMAPRTERMTFLFLNVGSKLCFSIAFVVIRGNEYHRTLTGVLKKLSTSNVAIVSILRGSFDMLLPCVADAEGLCKLSPANSGDMAQLEHTLQRPVAGLAFADLLADDSERARFAAYVRNSHRQAIAPKALGAGSGEWSVTAGGALPPIAQVLNCRLAVGMAVEGERGATLGCAVHLSVVSSSASWGVSREMIAAVRLTDDSSMSRPEEAIPAPEFKEFDETASTAGGNSSETMSLSDDQSGQDERVVASLMDVARLGMSALLRSNRSVSEAEDNHEVDSGYDDDARSYLKSDHKQSTGTLSGINQPGKPRSVVSEREGSVLQVTANPRPRAARSAPSVCSSQGGASQRVTTPGSTNRLPEPEEESFSRSTTPWQEVEKTVVEGSKSVSGGEEAQPQANVTVTIGVSPVQFGLAVGTVALAASVSLLCRRR